LETDALRVVAVGAGEVVVGVVEAQEARVRRGEGGGVVVVDVVRRRRGGREKEEEGEVSRPDVLSGRGARRITSALDFLGERG
jgi:hypothetical protein